MFKTTACLTVSLALLVQAACAQTTHTQTTRTQTTRTQTTWSASQGVAAAAPVAMALKSEREIGADLYFRACGLCHDDSEHMLNDNGPALFGVVGRRVGSVEGFTYSPALQEGYRKGHTWSQERLDDFLSGPQHLYSGTDMPMMFNDPRMRQALIAYLKSLKPAG